MAGGEVVLLRACAVLNVLFYVHFAIACPCFWNVMCGVDRGELAAILFCLRNTYIHTQPTTH